MLEPTRVTKSKFYTHLDGPSTLFRYEDFSATGRAGGAVPPSVNWDPLISRKLLQLESRNSTHISVGPSTLFRYENLSARGRAGGSAPTANLGPPAYPGNY